MLIAFSVGALVAIAVMLLKVGLRGSSVIGKTGVVPIAGLFESLLLDEPPVGHAVQVSMFRQSGNAERALICANRTDAFIEVRKMFNRMQEPSARIWANKPDHCDLRRQYGNFRGRNEGKKLWGCRLDFVKLE